MIKTSFFYQTPLLQKTGLVQHAFTTRKGGVSQFPYASLNLALHVGDEKEAVWENRKIVAQALGLPLVNWVAAQQVHGEKIALVQKEDVGKGAYDYQSAFADTDALITNVPGLVLSVYSADCVSILLLDTKERAIAAVHAGWKGTANKIVAKTLEKMKECYGTLPENCLAAIGPSIGPNSFLVDEQVLHVWQEKFSYWSEVTKKVTKEKWLIDLWETNKRQLIEKGVVARNIAVSGLSTAEKKEEFFSYRAEDGKTGRMAALISILPKEIP